VEKKCYTTDTYKTFHQPLTDDHEYQVQGDQTLPFSAVSAW
jgi:hypothetical protein